MKWFLAVAFALAAVGCLAFCDSAEAGIFGSRVIVRSRPVVVRQRAAVIVPRRVVAPAIVAPAIVAPAVVAPAVVVPRQQILIAPY